MLTITEPQKNIPVVGEYNVVVAGGGVAGIAAALAAKRAGAEKVLLIEKQFALGGLATLGLVTYYLPLCDGWGNQACFGIAEELLKLSIKYGAEIQYPDAWLKNKSKEERTKQRYRTRYNAPVFAILAEQLLLKEGVDIMFGTLMCAVKVKTQKITHLIIEDKSGRRAIKAQSVVDSSGDADVCKLAGAETVLFSHGNILASWHYYIRGTEYNLKMMGYYDVPEELRDKVPVIPPKKRYAAVEADELTQMTIDSHNNLLNQFLSASGGKINSESAIATMATIPQVRRTRRIKGVYDVDIADAYRHFNDSIGVIPDWRRPGDVYEIPFSSLYGKDIKNLITAGRCISATDDMWELTRVIPPCAITGEAAGAAAAMTDDFSSIDINRLQKHLKSKGAQLSCANMGRKNT